MILKVYIRKHLFHLPRKQDDLTELIKEKFYKRKPLVKSGFTKLYRISDIENSEIQYEKDVNIFLINLYLEVLDHQGKLTNEKDISITLSDDNIKKEIATVINEDIHDLSIEDIEKKVDDFLNEKDTSDKKTSDKENTTKKENNLNVKFSIEWVKNMDKKLRE